MVIDTSAIIAILLGEPEAGSLARTISDHAKRLMSAFSALECSIVIEAKKGEMGGRELDLLLHRTHIDVVSMDIKQYEIARSAWRNYGKGRHRAALDIGDCCSYALAKYSGESLLYTGVDFSFTDVISVPTDKKLVP